MKVLLTGGGTGGHITPLLAVADAVKARNAETKVMYVGERGGKFSHLTNAHNSIDASYSVFSGKFRRYHGQPWVTRLLDIKTIFLNIRDFFSLLIGIIQSYFLIGKIRPDVVFLKGGYVGVPIGLACALRGVPFITHDSDAIPGLANRIVGRWASIHATALPAKEYNYPKNKTKQVGVIVSNDYLRNIDRVAAKKKLSIKAKQVLLITGGSTGAHRLNKAVVSFVDKLLSQNTDLEIVHQVGRGKAGCYKGYLHERLQIHEFLSPMYLYSAAADVVITRAGANTLAELAVQGRACIVVPNPQLTDGHQTKNGKILEEQGAALVVDESDLPEGLFQTTNELLKNQKQREKLASKFSSITISDAADKIAALLLN